MTHFIAEVQAHGVTRVRDYATLYDWSVAKPEEFWAAVWRFCGVVSDVDAAGAAWQTVLVGGHRMAPPEPEKGPRWFDGARLNFSENLLRHRDDGLAIVSWNELGAGRRLTYTELHAEVARAARALREHGVREGDRIVGFMPNIPEAAIAMLATASIGAIWSSCSPDFGVDGVLDRFGQIAPRILFCADGYRYSGKEIDSLRTVAGIAER